MAANASGWTLRGLVCGLRQADPAIHGSSWVACATGPNAESGSRTTGRARTTRWQRSLSNSEVEPVAQACARGGQSARARMHLAARYCPDRVFSPLAVRVRVGIAGGQGGSLRCRVGRGGQSVSRHLRERGLREAGRGSCRRRCRPLYARGPCADGRNRGSQGAPRGTRLLRAAATDATGMSGAASLDAVRTVTIRARAPCLLAPVPG